MKTVDYACFVESRIKNPALILAALSADKVNLIHMMLGAVGEWHEYAVVNTRENVIEELGDMRFYLVGALMQLKLDWPSEVVDRW